MYLKKEIHILMGGVQFISCARMSDNQVFDPNNDH